LFNVQGSKVQSPGSKQSQISRNAFTLNVEPGTLN
jgi:hypothetical protein